MTRRQGPRRTWLRRVTYVLASGAAITGLAAWMVRRDFVRDWALAQLDAVSRQETGLPLKVEDLELRLLSGRIVLHRAAWGEDFLTVKRIEAVVDPLSLLGSRWSVGKVLIEEPRLILDSARLARIRLRARPPSMEPLKVSFGEFRLAAGQIEVREPRWQLPKAEIRFQVRGTGLGWNHGRAELSLDRMVLDQGGKPLAGRALFDLEASEEFLALRKGDLQLGNSRVAADGRLAIQARAFDAKSRMDLDLQQLAGAFGGKEAGGRLRLDARAKGTLAQPQWELDAEGSELGFSSLPLAPGQFHMKAKGGLHRAQVASLDWESGEGKAHLEGQWEQAKGSQGRLAIQDFDLKGLAAFLRADPLQALRANLDGDFRLPGDPWNPVRLDRVELTARVALTRGGQEAGRASVKLAQGLAGIEELNLRLPELDLAASGSAQLGPGRLESIQGEGKVRVDAAQVAKVLEAWKIVGLDMGGRTEASGSVRWDRAQGLKLDGAGEVLNPRWHGAQADRVRSDVSIRGTQLWVGNTELFKGDGRGWGELRLDWGDLPRGADALDLCYRAFRLPVAEGLKAADLGDLPMSGLGSAWVRIRGPFEDLHLTGEGLLEDGRVYGLRLPSGLAGIDFDLAGNHLRIPEFRVAESAAQLGSGDAHPEGLLAVQGSLDMDLDRKTWTGRLSGAVDSTALDLPGPRFQARVEASLSGPWTRPFGPIELPEGRVDLSQGRLFIGEQSVEDLQGSLLLQDGALDAVLGRAPYPTPILRLEAWSEAGTIQGGLDLQVRDTTADTPRLAQRLTQDLLKDLVLDAQAEGRVDAKGLRWKGRIRELAGYFQGFDLKQVKTGQLDGDAASMNFDLQLEGHQGDGTRPKEPGKAASPTANLQLAGKLPFSAGQPGRMRLVGSGQLADLKTILDHLLELENASGLLADLKPEGRATVDLTASGQLTDPGLDGTLSLSGGRLMLRTFPQSVEDVSFTLQFKGKEILLPESDPLMGGFAQGNIGVWGRAVWGMGGLTRYDLRASLMDFQLRDVPAGFELQGSLDASLSGNDLTGGVLRGTLDAERAAYRTDISLGDLILNRSIGATPDLAGLDPDDPLGRIDLDLDLNLRQPWDIDTNLLKIKGRPEGPFKILGSLARPGLKGRMEILPGGRLTNLLPAGDVVLERSTIDFTDPLVMNPVLSLEGRIDVPPYLVTLAINGTLDQLNLVPTSTPSLRQDEVVAILIDPTIAQSLGTTAGPTSQTVLTTGFLGAGQSLLVSLAFANFQETLRKTLNLDRVNASVRTGSTGNLETAVTLGKSFELFGSRTPIIGTYRRSGELVTLSGQVEWRFGNFVLQFGASGSKATGIDPTGEIRHTWSPR